MAKQILGKTVLNQGADDDAIFEGKSSDVAHGITDFAETDTYFLLQKAVSTTGGLLVRSFTEDITGTKIQSLVTNESTNKSNAAPAAVAISAHKKNGTGLTPLGADANILAVDNGDTVRFILDADGDSHQDVGTAWTNFDVTHDVEMLNVLSAFVTRKTDPLRQQFGRWLAVPENRDRLEALGLATFNDHPGGDGSIFVNMSRLTMLLVGAMRQTHDRLTALEARVATLLPAGA